MSSLRYMTFIRASLSFPSLVSKDEGVAVMASGAMSVRVLTSKVVVANLYGWLRSKERSLNRW